MNSDRPWVVIGNDGDRRVDYFRRALATRGIGPPRLFAWRDLISGTLGIERIPRNAYVRVESPGEDFEVEKLLLCSGSIAARAEGSPTIPCSRIRELSFDRGRILNTRQWYLGFRKVLRDWQLAFRRRPDLLVCSSPSDIATMFDKRQCHLACEQAGLPVPARLGECRHFDQLIARMEAAGFRGVFVKPAHGSSASGVVALRRRNGGFEAFSSAEIVRTKGGIRLYNSLRIRQYTDLADLRDLIGVLLANHAHVEQWMPKAMIGRQVCDMRVVVIAGDASQMIVRTSRSPFTNLHLGNRRADVELLRDRVPDSQWTLALDSCRRVARCFPRSLRMGVDLMFTPGGRRHFVLEVNAFGDLLPNVLLDGRDSYLSQVDAIRSGRFAP